MSRVFGGCGPVAHEQKMVSKMDVSLMKLVLVQVLQWWRLLRAGFHLWCRSTHFNLEKVLRRTVDLFKGLLTRVRDGLHLGKRLIDDVSFSRVLVCISIYRLSELEKRGRLGF